VGWGPLWASSSSSPSVPATPSRGTRRSEGEKDTHKGPPIHPTPPVSLRSGASRATSSFFPSISPFGRQNSSGRGRVITLFGYQKSSDIGLNSASALTAHCIKRTGKDTTQEAASISPISTNIRATNFRVSGKYANMGNSKAQRMPKSFNNLNVTESVNCPFH
jgi:hypothetical protein